MVMVSGWQLQSSRDVSKLSRFPVKVPESRSHDLDEDTAEDRLIDGRTINPKFRLKDFFGRSRKESRVGMEEIEGRDIFAEDFVRQEQSIMESETPSDIQRFFEDATIFISGGTGFFGKILTEKLLRQCSKLNRIYLLMRPKKGKTAEERFEEQFDGPLFDLMKKANPNYRNQVFIIQGDMAKEDGIISEEDRQMLIQNVDIVFHCAATVRFDEKLRRAVNINIKGTKFLLDMAHEMKNLKAFLHVSTAYSNCPQKEIDEKFYTPPYDYAKISDLLRILDDNVLDQITPTLLDKFPNTYAFTKMIAEHVVQEYGKGLPIAVFRPSIVISTHKQPISGWINNFYGPQGVVFGAAVGLLRTLHCDPEVLADLVPVDLVINALIALAWDLGQTKGDNPNFEKVSWREALDSNPNVEKRETAEEIPVLNYVSSERNPITWGQFLFYNYKAGKESYSKIQLWHSSLTLNANPHVNRIYRLLCHYGPALVIDGLALVLRKKPIMWNSYKKIHKFSEVISYFCTSQWKFKEENVIKLWKKLSPKDRIFFNFDIQDLEWEQYFQCYMKGLRVYLANDTLTSLPEGRRRAIKLKIYHFSLLAVLNLLLLYTLYRIFCYLFI